MPPALFRCIAPYLKYTQLIYLQGWGEPLLHPNIFELIQMSKKLKKQVGFTTSGMLLTENAIQRLIDLEVDMISISLAGATASTHDRIRRGTDFNQIMSNLSQLQQAKSERKSNQPSVHFSYLLLKSNIHEITKVISLAKKFTVRQIVASHPALVLTAAIHEEAVFNHPGQADAQRALLEEIRTQAAQENILFAYRNPKPDPAFCGCTENVGRACVLTVAGEICPCVYTNPALAGAPGRNGLPAGSHLFQGQTAALKPLSFGNINSHSLTKIWNLKEYADFRDCFEPERRPAGDEDRSALPSCCLTCHKRLGL